MTKLRLNTDTSFLVRPLESDGVSPFSMGRFDSYTFV